MEDIILSIETSTRAASVAITRGCFCESELILNTDVPLSRKLFKMIADILQYSGITYSSIDAVSVSCGPGGYTGLRMGMASAKSISFSLGIPLFSIPTFEVMLQGLQQFPHKVQPFIDAKRNEVYTATFSWSQKEGKYIRLSPDVNIKTSDFISMLQDSSVLFGDISSMEKHGTFFDICKAKKITLNNVIPKASYLGLLGAQELMSGKEASSLKSSPYYIGKAV